jgi:hypothetical protein
VPETTLATYTRASNAWIQIPVSDLLAGYASDADGDPLTLLTVGAGTNGATVIMSGDLIYYLPSNTHSLCNTTDHLPYVITDGYPGGTATNQIRIKLEAPSTANPAIIGEIKMGMNGAELIFTGSPNVAYQIERTTALDPGNTIWLSVGSTTTDGEGRGGFLDANPPAGQGFYRVVWQ